MEARQMIRWQIDRSVRDTKGEPIADQKMSETIKVNAVLGGTFLKPTINLKYGAGDTKTAVKDVVNNAIADKRAELETKAQAKIDTVKAKATEKVKDAIADKLNSLFKKKN